MVPWNLSFSAAKRYAYDDSTAIYRVNAASPQHTQQLSDVSAIPVMYAAERLTGRATWRMLVKRCQLRFRCRPTHIGWSYDDHQWVQRAIRARGFLLVFCSNHSRTTHCCRAKGMGQTDRWTDRGTAQYRIYEGFLNELDY